MRLIWIFLLIVMIISAGCTFKTKSGEIIKLKPGMNKECETKKGIDKEDCYHMKAIQELNISLCEYAGEPVAGNEDCLLCRIRYVCYTNVVLRTNNFDLCDETSDPSGCLSLIEEVKNYPQFASARS